MTTHPFDIALKATRTYLVVHQQGTALGKKLAAAGAQWDPIALRFWVPKPVDEKWKPYLWDEAVRILDAPVTAPRQATVEERPLLTLMQLEIKENDDPHAILRGQVEAMGARWNSTIEAYTVPKEKLRLPMESSLTEWPRWYSCTSSLKL
jgi:hypothetical protein